MHESTASDNKTIYMQRLAGIEEKTLGQIERLVYGDGGDKRSFRDSADEFQNSLSKYHETTERTMMVMREKLTIYNQLFKQLQEEHGIHVVKCGVCEAIKLSGLKDAVHKVIHVFVLELFRNTILNYYKK